MKQQRLLATAPAPVTEEDIAGIFTRVDGGLVTATTRPAAGEY